MCASTASPAAGRPPVSVISPMSPAFPPNLSRGGCPVPRHLYAIGSLAALHGPVLGFFCSARLPGRIIVEAYEWAQSMKLRDAAVAGGFHAPMEQVCFRAMLRGRTRLVVCPPRNITRMRVPADWQAPIASGRLLVLSQVEGKVRRATRELASQRNLFVASLVDALFIPHAARGSATEQLAIEAVRRGTPLYTIAGPENSHLLHMGALSLDEMRGPW